MRKFSICPRRRHSFDGITCKTVLAIFATQSLLVQAQLVVDPGFETGLTGWDTAGDTRTVTGAYGISPPAGNFQALITNNQLQNPAPITASALETFLGLNAGSLTAVGNGTAVEGSAILQQFSVVAGQTLTLSWNFATEEDPQLQSNWANNDFGFAMVRPAAQTGDQNSIVTLATVRSLVLDIFTAHSQVLPSPSQASTDFKTGATGYRTFSYTFPTSGVYALGIGVLDVGQGSSASFGNSGVLVDNVNLSLVPEPRTWTLVAGLAMAAVAVTRRFRASARVRTLAT